MSREQAEEYVSWVLDDAGSAEALYSTPTAVVREPGLGTLGPRDEPKEPWQYGSVLVGWQCGFEPMFVAVHSYLDERMDEDEAVELATEYLEEIGWFSGPAKEPDYVL